MHELDLKTNSTLSRYNQSILPSPLQPNIILDSYYKTFKKVTHIESQHGSLPAPRKTLTTNVYNRRSHNPNPCQASTGYAAPRAEIQKFKIHQPNSILLTVPLLPAWRGEAPWTADLPFLSAGRPWLRSWQYRNQNLSRVCRSRHQTRNLSRLPLTLSPPTRISQWTDDSLALDGMF